MSSKINPKIFLTILFIGAILFGLFSAKAAFASTFNLSGEISDSFGNIMAGTSVSVTDANTGANAGNTTTDSSGNYSLIVIGGTYNVQVTPPAGSNFSPAIALGQNIFSDTRLNFILVPIGQVSLAGHVYDQYGNPLPNQNIHIAISGSGWSATTDASGYYSFPPLSPGLYNYFEVYGSNDGGTLNLPSFYDIQTNNFSLTQSTIKDVTLNARKVTVHVQDPAGNPLSGVGVSVRLIDNSTYGSQTDASGNGILWLFDGAYNIAANPPSGSAYNNFTLNNVSVTGDQTEIISLQFINAPPVIDTFTALQDSTAVGSNVNINATFTDINSSDTHTAVWDWGDSTSSSGNISESNGSGISSGIHSYTSAGVYTVTLAITDNQNASDSEIYQYIVVYDPDAGYVTGAGTITSPIGAYTQDLSLSGKAIFGFVSKYQNGANQPTGSTQFRFIIANFSFKSTSYDWLVVGGARAQYKGSGTINGTGDYGFILSSIDGQLPGGGGADKFRIKITDKTTGDVVYDNQLGASDTSDPATAIDSGSITIHQ